MNLRLCIPVLACLFCILSACHAADQRYSLIEPDLDRDRVGFELKHEEYIEYCEQIRSESQRTLGGGAQVVLAQAGRIAELTGSRATVLVFDIEKFYLRFSSQGERRGVMVAALLIFDPGQGYASARYLKGRAMTGECYGRNTPLEDAIEGVFANMREVKRSLKNAMPSWDGLTPDFAISRRRLPWYPCDSTVLLVAPHMGADNMSLELHAEERRDFTYYVADHVRSLLKRQVNILDTVPEGFTDECRRPVVEVKFNRMRGDCSIRLVIREQMGGEPVFRSVDPDPSIEEWELNHVLAKVIDRAFTVFAGEYARRGN